MGLLKKNAYCRINVISGPLHPKIKTSFPKTGRDMPEFQPKSEAMCDLLYFVRQHQSNRRFVQIVPSNSNDDHFKKEGKKEKLHNLPPSS